MSFVGDAIGDVFGGITGASATEDAAKQSNKLGYQTLAMQQDWLDYIKGQYEPYSKAGQRALKKQEGLLSQLSAGPDYEAAANSEAFQEANRQAQYSLLNSAEATGGLGSTATGNALGASSANVLSSVANENYGNLYNYYNALGAISGQGMQGSQSLGSFGGNVLSGMSGTMSGIGSNTLNAAAANQESNTALLSAGAGLLTAFSDIRLKKNIKATGEFTKRGNEIYTWDWNEKAEKLGLSSSGRGVIADHAESITPEAVSKDKSGYKVVDYARV
nr:tail fiber domain-containing protein [uncultured Vibrio sp.]